jgi:putative ABC transport system permease protein
MRTLWQDVRYGLRVMRKSPGFTAVAVVALALGIGANTAIFSVVNAMLLRALPYEGADRLVAVYTGGRQNVTPEAPFSYPDLADLRAQSHTLERVSGYQQTGTVLSAGGEEPERVRGVEVNADLFPMLGARAAAGRVFTEEDDAPGAPPVVVISDGLWRRRFGSDPNVVGRQVKMGLSGRAVTVVGVLAPGFKFPAQATEQVDFYVPFTSENVRYNKASMENRDARFIPVVAKLREGVTLEQAAAEADTVAARLAEQYPESNTGRRIRLVPLHEDLVGGVRRALLILLGAVGFVLLIACANVANLTLARATARAKEMAVRTALGASRWRIARQLLTESLLLALAGGALGLLLASWGVELLVKLSPADVPLLGETSLDAPVFLFTLGVSLATGLVFGVAPALHSSKFELSETLKEGGRGGTEGGRRSRVRNVLVVSEVALSLVLLVGAGLLLRSFVRLLGTDPGYSPERVLTLRVALSTAKYPDEQARAAFFRDALERVRAVPGVEAAAVTNLLPLGPSDIFNTFQIEGRPPFAPDEQRGARSYSVTPEYFRVLGVALRRGRAFNDADDAGAQPVIVVNEAFERLYFPGGDALGARISLDDDSNVPQPARVVVGVVGNVRFEKLNGDENAEYYIPYFQGAARQTEVVVRSKGPDMAPLTASVRAALKAADPNLLIWETRTMDELVGRSVAPQRFNATLLGLFALIALVLASVGIYGVMSYTVEQRTHEIGVRMALGAQRRDVLRLVVGRGMTMALAGVALGLAASFALTRVMSSLLFEVSATDAATFVAVPVLLSAVALVACLVPAWRAMKVDPMVALRYE